MTLVPGKFTVQTKFKDYIGTISFACPACNHVSVELLEIMDDQLLADLLGDRFILALNEFSPALAVNGKSISCSFLLI